MKHWFIYIIVILALHGCNKFEYSPYQQEGALESSMPSDLNQLNIKKLFNREENADDTVTILFTGDSQRFYDGLEKLVDKTNSLSSVDFLIMNGDIADFGLLQEFKWIVERLNKLKCPYLCAIGNHDIVADNGKLYTKIFGDKNFSFTYKGYKFLFHDTNGREYNFNGNAPNMWWLQDQLNDSNARWFVGVSHVPPFDADFDPALIYPYKNLLASTQNFAVSLHGHVHTTTDTLYYNDGVRYITSNSVEKSEAIILKLINGKVIKQIIKI